MSRQKAEVESSDNEDTYIIAGRRIVELEVMAKLLYCPFCKALLSLENVEKEKQAGLVSILHVRCRECLLVTHVPTGKTHPGPTGSDRQIFYDTNSKAALGKLLFLYHLYDCFHTCVIRM